MIEQLFQTIIFSTITGSVLILLLILLSPIMAKKIPARWRYYLWVPVLLQLLIIVPLAPAVPNQVTQPVIQFTDSVSHKRPVFKQSTLPVGNTKPSAMEQEPAEIIPAIKTTQSENQVENKSIDFYQIADNAVQALPLIWLMGFFASLFWMFIVYALYLRKLQPSRMESDLFLAVCSELGIRRKIVLKLSGKVNSPMLLGVFCPCVVIPNQTYSNSELRYIFMHELMHFKRNDLLLKWFVELVKAIHWFNPFVYLMSKKMNQECELSCDEAVVQRLGNAEVQDYGKTILEVLARATWKQNTAFSTSMCEKNKNRMKDRLTAILNFKQSGKAVVIIASLLILVVVGTGLFLGGVFKGRPETSINAFQTNETKPNVQVVYGYSNPFEPGSNDAVQIEDWLYTNIYDSKNDKYCFAKINQNGDQTIILLNKPTYFRANKGNIYFLENGIKKMNLDGSQITKIYNDMVDEFYFDNNQIILLKNDIIYSLQENGEERFICKNDFNVGFKVCAGWIYYSWLNENYRIKTNGTMKEKLLQLKNVYDYFVKEYNGDMYYCVDSFRGQQIFRNEKLIHNMKGVSGNLIGFIIHNDNIYFMSTMEVIQYNMKTGHQKLINKDISLMVLNSEGLYCFLGYKILLYDVEGNLKKSMVTNSSEPSEYCSFFGDWYYCMDLRVNRKDDSIQYFTNGKWEVDLERDLYDQYFGTNMSFKCLNSKEKVHIYDFKLEDVTGDGIKDEIFTASNDRIVNGDQLQAFVIIKNGMTQEYKASIINTKLSKPYLYVTGQYGDRLMYGSLDIADFNGDGAKDIFLKYYFGDGGGSGENWAEQVFCVLSFKNDISKFFVKGRSFIYDNFGDRQNFELEYRIEDVDKDGLPEIAAYKGTKLRILYKYDPVQQVMVKKY